MLSIAMRWGSVVRQLYIYWLDAKETMQQELRINLHGVCELYALLCFWSTDIWTELFTEIEPTQLILIRKEKRWPNDQY